MTAMATSAENVDEQIGAQVHQLMWSQRLTQKAVADALGIQQSAMSRKLRGTRPWLANEVAVVARVLGVTPGDLYPDSATPATPPPAPASGAAAVTGR